jgi:hypothetical protein
MIRNCARLLLGILVPVVFAATAQAQSLEVHAGGKRFNESPALDTPVWPNGMTLGPDGNLYVTSHTSEDSLLRLDLANGTVSVLPAQSDQMPFRYIWDVDYGQNGTLYAMRASQVVALNLADGTHEVISGALEGGGLTHSCYSNGWNPPSYPSQADFATSPNGNIYVVDRNKHWICVINQWGYSSRAVGVGGWGGYSGDGGPAEYAELNSPTYIATDAAGNLYISDNGNARIRKVNAEDGIITTIAGNGQWNPSPDWQPAASSSISNPGALAVDPVGNVFFWEGGDNRLRRIDAVTGLLGTVAGNGESGFSGDGGPATQAALIEVTGIVIAPNGDLYLSDQHNKRVRRVAADTGVITTVLGNGENSFCGEGAPRLETCLNFPQGVAVNTQGDMFISDSGNMRIRKISGETGLTTTIAGRSGYEPSSGDGGPAVDATFGNTPAGIALDAAGNLYIAGWWDHRIRRIDAATSIITTIAGTGVEGFSGDGGPATAARLNLPEQLAIDAAGNLYFSEGNGNRVRRVDAGTGVISTVAGTGSASGPIGDGGPATLASLSSPAALVFDSAGRLLIADTWHARVRRVDLSTGIITTIAGDGTWNNTPDAVPATSTGIGAVTSLAFDAGGNLYLASNGTMRRIDAVTGIMDRVPPGYMGLATPDGTWMSYPKQMTFDAQGQLYVTDSDKNVVWHVKDLPPAITDSTPPVIQANVVGEAGNDGWYRSDVQLSWSVNDAESAVSSSDGCSSSSVSSDTDGITFTCTATSAGGTATESVTIKRDTVAPTLTFGLLNPAADANGWHQSDVQIGFVTEDALSGVYSTSTPDPVVITSEGTGLTQQVTVTDQAGNSATFTTPAVNIDRSAPIVEPNVAGPLGDNGWYRGNVSVSFSVADAGSALLSQDGCGAASVATDTTGVTFTCIAISHGGTTTRSVTIKRDATAPTLEFGALDPAPNAAGWNNTSVSIPYTTSDATSGVQSPSPASPLVFDTDGEGMFQQVSVADFAGNVAVFESPRVNIDRTPPVVQPVVTGTLGSNGWYTSDVQVHWSISDIPTIGCDDATVDADTSGITLSCTATSAGGTSSASVTIKRDATPPALNFGTPSPAPNASGWNKVNVSIPFTHSDAMSGIASTSVASPLVLSTEGEGITGQVVLTDNAGNSATFTSVPRNIDKSVPVVGFASPAEGATYGFYQDVVADYSCTDTSLVSCTAPTANGGLINTRTAGVRTFKVTAKDAVAFTTAVTHTFTVESLFNFDGFLAPASAPPTLNLVARGALVPIRWRLPDGRGGFVTNPASFYSATVGSLTCGSAPSVPLNDTAEAPVGISFDAATNSFIYNWQTSSSWTGCRKLTIRLKDNSTHELRFKFQ